MRDHTKLKAFELTDRPAGCGPLRISHLCGAAPPCEAPQPCGVLVMPATISSTVTMPSVLTSALTQSSDAASPCAMATAVITSSTCTSPSPLQSPGQGSVTAASLVSAAAADLDPWRRGRHPPESKNAQELPHSCHLTSRTSSFFTFARPQRGKPLAESRWPPRWLCAGRHSHHPPPRATRRPCP